MRVTRIEIENFRSIRKLSVELGETTVFVGPNNAGKTAILDALRIALTRRWGQRGTGFTEHDIHLEGEGADPKTSPGAKVEIHVEESESDEWPTSITEGLGQIVQLDLERDLRSISLRVRWAWNDEMATFEPSWEFLDAGREPLVGLSARRINREAFWRYLPVFYLGALRDSADQFSPRSQFWGRLLDALEIPAGLEARAKRVLNLLNSRLLKADSRLEDIAETLSRSTRIAVRDRGGNLQLRMAPQSTRELLSRAEVILRNEPDSPWLPLRRQGQGLQSLSVVFLFEAFVNHLLEELYEPDSEPVLALEEPETHLHPQATRALWAHVSALPGQKIVTTHSPYFVQHVPFRDLRIVRLTKQGTIVHSLPARFTERVPHVDAFEDVAKRFDYLVHYDRVADSGILTIEGALDDDSYRALLRGCGDHTHRPVLEASLRKLRDRSAHYMSDEELRSLETFARRMRGEIFFAERWLIVEGQADYLVLNALARAMAYDLDVHGVSVVDAKNNGNPATLAAFARALGIPWLAVFDGDDAGREYLRDIRKRGFSSESVDERCRLHEHGDLESQLVVDGVGPELREILVELDVRNAADLTDQELSGALRQHKTKYAAALAGRLETNKRLAQRLAPAFRWMVGRSRNLRDGELSDDGTS